jgi:hypothetical protein
MTQDSNQIEDLKTFKEENGETWRWNYWRDQLANSIKESKDYLDESERIINIFKGNSYRTSNQAGDTLQVKPVYNILYSNVETLKPLVFSRLPNPRVRKRNLEKNNINKLISIILERNIKRVLEETDAQNVIEQSRDDYLVTKRGVLKVLFEQEIEVKERAVEEVDEMGNLVQRAEEYEELGEKKIFLEYVSYKDIVFSCASKWEDVDWVAFRHYMTKDELKKKFGRKTNLINLDNEVAPNTLKDDGKDGIFKKAEVWEIWDKETKKVYFFCEGYDRGLLKIVDDSYNLEKFFNIPRPLGIDSGFDKVNCPIQDYKYYEEQAKELDKISNRIIAILPYMSMGGVYSDSLTTDDAETFLQAIERYYPVKMPPDADINKMIRERDLSKLAGVLTTLYTERQQTIQAIQEITGISDIVRGQTQAQETATAQELKGNFAVSRLQPMQQEIEFFCRDTVRIIAELLAENYDIVELVQAAGLKIFDMDEMAEKFTKELEQQGLPPEQFGQALQAKLKPYTNEIKAGQATTINNMIQAAKILKSDKLRGWAIEVETDSTIKVDQNSEKQAALDFSNALATVAGQFLPLVQAGVISKEAFKSLLSYVMRRFEGSEEVEELLDDTDDQETNPAEQMQQQAAQKEMELAEREMAVKEFSAQSKAAYDNRKLDIDEGKAIMNDMSFADEMRLRQEQINSKIQQSNA